VHLLQFHGTNTFVTFTPGATFWATGIPAALQPLYLAIQGCTSSADLVRKRGCCCISVEHLLEALLYEAAMETLLKRLKECYKDGQFQDLDPRSFELESGCAHTDDLLGAEENSVFVYYRA